MTATLLAILCASWYVLQNLCNHMFALPSLFFFQESGKFLIFLFILCQDFHIGHRQRLDCGQRIRQLLWYRFWYSIFLTIVNNSFVQLRLNIRQHSHLGPLLSKVTSFKISTICERILVGRSEVSSAGSI